MTRREHAEAYAALPVVDRVRLAFGDPPDGDPVLEAAGPVTEGGPDEGTPRNVGGCAVAGCDRPRRGALCAGHETQRRRGKPFRPLRSWGRR